MLRINNTLTAIITTIFQFPCVCCWADTQPTTTRRFSPASSAASTRAKVSAKWKDFGKLYRWKATQPQGYNEILNQVQDDVLGVVCVKNELRVRRYFTVTW